MWKGAGIGPGCVGARWPCGVREEDVEAEAARYVGGCIGSHMAGFPDKPSAEELIGALRAGAVTGRQRTIVEGLFAGMDAGSARRRRRGPS